MSSQQDQTLTCADCGAGFAWSAGEQEFLREKGFTDPPRRCKECKQAREEQRGGVERRGGRD